VEHHPSGATCFGVNLEATNDEELAKVNPSDTLKQWSIQPVRKKEWAHKLVCNNTQPHIQTKLSLVMVDAR